MYEINLNRLSITFTIVYSEKRLEQHRKQESELRTKLEEQKGIEMQLNSRLAMLQNKLELLGTNSDSELVETYKQQNEIMRKDTEDLRAEIKNVSKDTVKLVYPTSPYSSCELLMYEVKILVRLYEHSNFLCNFLNFFIS